MSSQGAFVATAPAVETGPWASGPRYALADVPALLWRERRLMAAVFVAIFLAGAIAAAFVQRQYPAHASILVGLGEEYVYDPLAGDAGRGTVPAATAVLESERDILASEPLKRQVIADIGYDRLAPEHAHAFATADPARRARMIDALAIAIGRKLSIDTAPDTPVIRLTYLDTDPARAARVLNQLTTDYLVYRRKVLIDPTTQALDQQRRSFQERLEAADRDYQAFLVANHIGDFPSDKASLAALQTQVEQQRSTVEAQLRERIGRLAGLNSGLARVAPQINLYRDLDNTAGAKLGQLEVERQGLLSRYRPGATPVKVLDAQIATLENAMKAGQAQGPGAVRTGVNPVYQTVQTDALQVSAEVAALRQNLADLDAQTAEITDRSLHLTSLEPRYQELSRRRDLLAANLRDYTAKSEQARAAQEIAADTHDNIRIIERASPPSQGKSLRLPILALSLILAALSALAAGLARAFLRPGLPTPAAAARAYDLPVLGAAPLKA